MRAELAGLLCSGVILAPVVVYVVGRVVRFHGENLYEWASFHYVVRRSNSFVGDGDRFAREDFTNLDAIARDALVDWFDSEAGERALLHDSNRGRYSLTVQFRGRVGQAWG